MPVISQATKAANALKGGSGPQPTEDGAEAAAIWAVCDVVTDGAGTKVYDPSGSHLVIVGVQNVPNQGNLTSRYDENTGSWDGLQWR